MKKLLTMGLLLISGTCFAETREILCQEKPGISQGALALTLSNQNLSPQNNLFRIIRSFWVFQYSTASLVCSTDKIALSRESSFNCIGYNSAGGLTEVSIHFDQGVGSATVHNLGDGSVDNIYAQKTEGMILPCRLLTK